MEKKPEATLGKRAFAWINADNIVGLFEIKEVLINFHLSNTLMSAC